jgi:3-isopropylmalate/(R)-2-methylmalate dehydratase small subunit
MSGTGGGRAWVLGDDVNTDMLAPGGYMKFGIDEIARHCLESVWPDFAATVQAGDVVVGGRNFGAGSSREQAPQALKYLGVRGVVAVSFAGIFYRNALNLGLPLMACPDAGSIAAGDRLALDFAAGRVDNLSQGLTLSGQPIPPHLMAMVEDGGLMPHLEKRLRRERAEREETNVSP